MKRFKFTCSCCGEIHEGSPSFGFSAPHYYHILSEKDKEYIAKLSDDLCVITYENQTDRFVRAILEIPIGGCDEPFLWGVWVSLSEENFHRYCENFDSDTYQDEYFGWFCSQLPYYPDTLSLKAKVHVTPGGQRPELELESTDHQLSIDFHDGITWEQAVRIAEVAMHGNLGSRGNDRSPRELH